MFDVLDVFVVVVVVFLVGLVLVRVCSSGRKQRSTSLGVVPDGVYKVTRETELEIPHLWVVGAEAREKIPKTP